MIQTTEVSITYTGDGVQTSFPYPYPYRSSEDIVGYLVNEEGYEEKITTNYTYNNVENTYIYPLAGEPLKAPMKLKLIRETPQQQNSSLPNKLPFSLLEKGMDWIIMIIQEMGTRVNAIWNIKNDVAHSSTNAKEYMDRAESAASKSEDKAVSAEQSAQDARDWAATVNIPKISAGKIGQYMRVDKDGNWYLSLERVNVKDFGAKGDGVTDDTDAIKAALAVGASTVYFPDGTYMVQTAIEGEHPASYAFTIPSNTKIEMSHGCIVKGIPNKRQLYSIFKVFQVKNVVITGGHLIGDKALNQGEWGYGINVLESENVIIDGVEIENCLGDCISIDGYDYDERPLTQSKHVIVRNCKLHGSRRQGISITSGVDILIDSCEIYDISGTNPQSGIDLEQSVPNQIIKDIKLRNLYIHDTKNQSVLVYGHVDGLVIEDCRFTNDVYIKDGDNIFLSNVITAYGGHRSDDYFNGNIRAEGCNFSTCIVKNNFEGNNLQFNNCTFTYSHAGFEFIDVTKKNTVTFNGCTFIAKVYSDNEKVNYSISGDEDARLIFQNCLFDLDSPQFRGNIKVTEGVFENCDVKIKGYVTDDDLSDFTLYSGVLLNNRIQLLNSTGLTAGTSTTSLALIGNHVKGDNLKWLLYIFDNARVANLAMCNNIIQSQNDVALVNNSALVTKFSNVNNIKI